MRTLIIATILLTTSFYLVRSMIKDALYPLDHANIQIEQTQNSVPNKPEQATLKKNIILKNNSEYERPILRYQPTYSKELSIKYQQLEEFLINNLAQINVNTEISKQAWVRLTAEAGGEDPDRLKRVSNYIMLAANLPKSKEQAIITVLRTSLATVAPPAYFDEDKYFACFSKTLGEALEKAARPACIEQIAEVFIDHVNQSSPKKREKLVNDFETLIQKYVKPANRKCELGVKAAMDIFLPCAGKSRSPS